MSESPLARLRDNAVQIVSMAVTAVWLGALFLDLEWWLAALLVGYVFVVPLTKILAGEEDEDEAAHWTGDHSGTSDGSGTSDNADDDPLDVLRRRYAEGELTEREFEEKVERLVATEDREDAKTLLEERS